jgi:Trk K+ transport system NAD-binding subunit
MIVLVVAVQFVGVFLVYLVFPIYLIPFLEERFETRLPQEVAKDLADHVLIFRYGPAVETLLAELSAARVRTLVLERDEAVARQLFERGQLVLHRRLDEEALAAARLGRARALVANGPDDENAAFSLAARQLGYGGPILALVEEPFHRRPMMVAGATAVFTPRHILGAALAARASARINPRVAGVQQLGRHLQVAEIRIDPRSPLAGQTLSTAAIGERTGATVIGQWVGGELVVTGQPDLRLEPGGVLVVVGRDESVERLSELAGGEVSLRQGGRFVVGGGGEVGRKVAELLRAVGEEVLLIDRRPGDEVDLVGDVLDAKLLDTAGVRDAQAVILALDTDSATLFATVILRDLVPEVPIIARVNQAENVDLIHRAGAYFVLSISQVSGQMLAQKLLGQEAVSVDPQLKVLKVSPGGFRDRHPADLGLRERTGCSVVAVERGDDVLTELGPDFRFAPDDAVYVCGSTAAVRRFGEVFG